MYKKILMSLFIFSFIPFLTGCGKRYNSVTDFYNQMQLKKNSNKNIQFLLKVKLGNIKTQSTVYLSGKNSRVESSLDGGKTYPTISIKNEEDSYIYLPSSKTAYNVKNDSDTKIDALEWGDYDLSNFSFGKRKKYNDISCLEVVNYTKENKIYYCVSEKYGIPIVSKVSFGKDYNMESNIYNVKTSNISKKKFELPKGARIMVQGK